MNIHTAACVVMAAASFSWLAVRPAGAQEGPPLGPRGAVAWTKLGSGGFERSFSGPRPGAPLRVQSSGEEGRGRSTLALAKWGSLAVSAGASLYGFHVHGQADDEFRALQRICDADPERCRARNPDGSFSDADLEGRYQEVLDKDGSARAALILAQVGFAATIVLFIMDLGGSETPPDIPFEPPKLLVTPDGATGLSYSMPLPFR